MGLPKLEADPLAPTTVIVIAPVGEKFVGIKLEVRILSIVNALVEDDILERVRPVTN